MSLRLSTPLQTTSTAPEQTEEKVNQKVVFGNLSTLTDRDL
jgi:hypothetical protein